MKVLNKKLFRDIYRNKSQFISIFLMTFLGVLCFAGIHSYMDGMQWSGDEYYEKYNLQDLIISGENFNKDDLEEVKNISNVKDAERQLEVTATLNGYEDVTLDTIFLETNNISKFYIVDGEEFDKEKKGVWIDGYLAKNLDIKVGDELTINYKNYEIKEKVLGLINVPDHVYSIKDDTAIFPTHTDFGFVYLSINEFPIEFIYDEMLKSDEIKEFLNNIDTLKNMQNQGMTIDMIKQYAEIDSNIDLEKALDLADRIKESTAIVSEKEEFIKALNADFNKEDAYVFTTILVDVDDTSKIQDTKQELENKISSSLAITTREDLLSYESYQDEINEGKTYSTVFTALFLFIAILSVVTTMYRFVRKQRTQIGTMKALGIKRRKIIIHYVSFGFWISLISAILGLIVGEFTIGKFFLGMQVTYYEMPECHTKLLPIVYVLSAITVLVITFITYLSCKSVLKEKAADAIRVEVPKANPSKFDITTRGIFKNASLSTKWNLRDIARNKGRAIMGAVGVIGCTMILVCAFGMLDTMNSYIDWEFEKLYNFKYKLDLDNNISDENLNNLIEKYGSNTSKTYGIEFMDGDSKKANSLTINDASDMLQYTDHDINVMKLDDDGIYITEKLSETLNKNVGDEIEWHIFGEEIWYKTKIVGINRDPQNQSFNMTRKSFEDLGKVYNPGTIYTNEDLAGIKEIEGVSKIISKDNLKSGMLSMINTMYMMIVLLISVSAILAFVIIYNLGILSFAEKQYQFATLKVLGYKNKYIKKIFVKQNTWISAVSTIIGLPLGYLMTDYIFKSALGENYDFPAVITTLTYLYSTIGTLAVSFVVNKCLARKVKNIDMVTSLKGNE